MILLCCFGIVTLFIFPQKVQDEYRAFRTWLRVLRLRRLLAKKKRRLAELQRRRDLQQRERLAPLPTVDTTRVVRKSKHSRARTTTSVHDSPVQDYDCPSFNLGAEEDPWTLLQ